jgi:hypothetical protein
MAIIAIATHHKIITSGVKYTYRFIIHPTPTTKTKKVSKTIRCGPHISTDVSHKYKNPWIKEAHGLLLFRKPEGEGIARTLHFTFSLAQSEKFAQKLRIFLLFYSQNCFSQIAYTAKNGFRISSPKAHYIL